MGSEEVMDAATELTQNFLGKLCHNGVPVGEAIYEAYKFADAALRGDSTICARMDMAAAVIGRATMNSGVHPDQQRARGGA